MALLANAGGGSFTECSGSIVQLANGQAYVLTAAHCCTDGAPTVVVVGNNYAAGEPYLSGGNPPPGSGVFKVTAGSAYYDSAYNQYDHDFCMVKFAYTSNDSLSTLGLPSSCSTDGIANGVALEHVGFGMTNKNPNNSMRNHGQNNVSSFNATTVSYNEGSTNPGGNTGTPGTCEGDSGGPALIPAGAAQSQQTVVGVTSFGMTTTCGAQDTGTSSRVCSEIGTGKFITSYLNGSPIGTPAGQTNTSSCDTCQGQAQSGTCKTATQACANDTKCVQLGTCISNCQNQTCVDACAQTAGQAAVDKYNAFVNCICDTACPTECATECGGSGGCGVGSQDATCNTCLEGSCCSQAQACASNTTCVGCLSSPTAACNSNAQYTGFVQCLQNNCDVECLGGTSSSSSSSSGSATTSSSSSGNASTSSSSSSTSGAPATSSSGGAGGAGGEGGAGGDGGSSNNQESGCSVSAAGAGSDPASGVSLAGILVGLALAFSRRRRSA